MSLLQISQVPNPGNDLTYIAQTTPGAIMNTDTIGVYYLGNFSILGMPGTSIGVSERAAEHCSKVSAR
jgi:hypothetical protein